MTSDDNPIADCSPQILKQPMPERGDGKNDEQRQAREQLCSLCALFEVGLVLAGIALMLSIVM